MILELESLLLLLLLLKSNSVCSCFLSFNFSLLKVGFKYSNDVLVSSNLNPFPSCSYLIAFLTKSSFVSPCFTVSYIALKICPSFEKRTSNLAGCTLTSTYAGFISIFNIQNPESSKWY